MADLWLIKDRWQSKGGVTYYFNVYTGSTDWPNDTNISKVSRPIQRRNLVNIGPIQLNGGAIEQIFGLGLTVRRISLQLGTTVEGIISKWLDNNNLVWPHGGAIVTQNSQNWPISTLWLSGHRIYPEDGTGWGDGPGKGGRKRLWIPSEAARSFNYYYYWNYYYSYFLSELCM